MKRASVFIATRTRGFWNHLLKSELLDYKFTLHKAFEVNTKKRNLLYKLGHSRLCDILGIIQSIKIPETEASVIGSYNRFLNSSKPYFIYVETPTALYHYSLSRNLTFLGKKRANELASSSNLKGIVCMSNACYETFDETCFDTVEKNIIKKVIYPLVPDNQHINEAFIKEKCKLNQMKLLFIAQHVRLISKGLLNVLEMMDCFKPLDVNISLTVFTNVENVDVEILNRINSNNNITLKDFNLNFVEMEKVYVNHHVLIHPTSDDSCPLTVLESIKAGLPVISTNLFAIPEMVSNGYNGFLTDPQWPYYNADNKPNPEVWNNRSATRDKRVSSKRIVSFLVENVLMLYKERSLLEQLSLNSYEKAYKPPFSERYIADQWNEFIKELTNEG